MNSVQTVHSNGKLMLSGEYMVLHGAEAFALPTKLGQSMELTVLDQIPGEGHWIEWLALDHKGQEWIKDRYADFFELNFRTSDASPTGTLASILKALKQQENTLHENKSYIFRSKLEFDQSWGLGSSSTLLANLSKVLEVDPFELLDYSMGGSGYDIAVALTGKPTRYRLNKPMQASSREYDTLVWQPTFTDKLFLVHMGEKQSTSREIARFKEKGEITDTMIEQVNKLTAEIIACSDLSTFNQILQEHEARISEATGLKPVQTSRFSDFRGVVKSLGAWGGDFVLATGEEHIVKSYFEPNGFRTIVPFADMIQQA